MPCAAYHTISACWKTSFPTCAIPATEKVEADNLDVWSIMCTVGLSTNPFAREQLLDSDGNLFPS